MEILGVGVEQSCGYLRRLYTDDNSWMATAGSDQGSLNSCLKACEALFLLAQQAWRHMHDEGNGRICLGGQPRRGQTWACWRFLAHKGPGTTHSSVSPSGDPALGKGVRVATNTSVGLHSPCSP